MNVLSKIHYKGESPRPRESTGKCQPILPKKCAVDRIFMFAQTRGVKVLWFRGVVWRLIVERPMVFVGDTELVTTAL